MITMSPDLQRAVREGQTVHLQDPETDTAYVLVREDVFERFRALLEESPLTQDEQATLLRKAGERAGWDDPEMDAYDEMR